MNRRSTVECPAGKWTTIISGFGIGASRTYTVAFIPKYDEDVSGRYEENRYMLILPRKSSSGRLVPLMKFCRDRADTFYRVRVRPEDDIRARFKRGDENARG
ncbi:MAG: hypothetical protein R6U39_05480 [Candidatus Aegiribacteria sp.]